MKLKRDVSGNLGRTQHRRADLLYKQIKKRLGPTRPCPFYNGKKYPQFNPKSHDKLNPAFPNPAVPIEQYDFALNKKSGAWGLQAYCKVCYKAYRDARIGKSRETWIQKNGKPMTDQQIQSWYVKNVSPTMRCSTCRIEKTPAAFRISRSMEKGLHNVCIDCSAASGASVREQAWLSDGDWNSWKLAVQKMRKNKKVVCAGWPRSVVIKACKGTDEGKKMHADHRVPLRAGGLNDKTNFQALCGPCNIRKSDQIDPRLKPLQVKKLVGKKYKAIVKISDSTETIERKLKAALFSNISTLHASNLYLEAIKAKKKEVNGQFSIDHAFNKGVLWLTRGEKGIEE